MFQVLINLQDLISEIVTIIYERSYVCSRYTWIWFTRNLHKPLRRYRVTSQGGNEQGHLKDDSVYCSTRLPVRPVSSAGAWNEGVATGGGSWSEAGVAVAPLRIEGAGKDQHGPDPAYIHMLELRCEAHHGSRARAKTTPAIRPQLTSFKPSVNAGSTCLLPPPPQTDASDDSREAYPIHAQALTLGRYRYSSEKSSGITTERRLSSGCLITGMDSF